MNIVMDEKTRVNFLVGFKKWGIPSPPDLGDNEDVERKVIEVRSGMFIHLL